MLSVAETPWQAVSIPVLLLVGLVVTLRLARRFGVPGMLATWLYGWHTLFCGLYFRYSLNDNADATLYYLRGLAGEGRLRPGTDGVNWLTGLLADPFGLSYFGCFLVFNIIGMVGLLAFYGALRTLTAHKTAMARRMALVIVFLPGISFWSSAIGKDALAFMAAGLAVWALLEPARRWKTVLLALVLFAFVRPHVGAAFAGALAGGLFWSYKARPLVKLALLAVSVPLAGITVHLALSYIGIGLSELGAFLAKRQEIDQSGGASIDLSAMSVPARLFAYLFRPLFFDAAGLNALVVSLENALLLVLVVRALMSLGRNPQALPAFARTVFVLFVAVLWLVMANTTGNIGISIRQKWMFLPMLLALALSLWPQKRPRRAAGSSLINRPAAGAHPRPPETQPST